MRLDWNESAAEIGRAVRAFAPRSWFAFEGERIRVLKARVRGGRSKKSPGIVLDDRLTIACGKGVLRPLRVQRAGKSAMDASAFLRGTPIPEGTVLPAPPTSQGGERGTKIRKGND